MAKVVCHGHLDPSIQQLVKTLHTIVEGSCMYNTPPAAIEHIHFRGAHLLQQQLHTRFIVVESARSGEEGMLGWISVQAHCYHDNKRRDVHTQIGSQKMEVKRKTGSQNMRVKRKTGSKIETGN